MNQSGLMTAPNRKSVEDNSLAQEVAEGFDEFMQAFESFKSANDERLAQLENQKSADVITREKVERINQSLDQQKNAMDQLLLKKQRPSLGVSSSIKGGSFESMEHKNGFIDYMRSGNEQGLHNLEQKAMSASSDPDGGFLVPDVMANEILNRMGQMSPIRGIASVQQVSGSVYKKPFASTGPSAGWVGESGVRPETNSPILSDLQFPTMELYAMPAATSTLLEDAAVDMDKWLIEEVETAFAEQETAAFINGDGVNKPLGFLATPTVDQSTWSWGNLGYLPTGASAGFDVGAGMDVLIDAIYSVKAGYRQNSNWVMNRKVQAEIRKIKDADGNYIWQPPTGSENKARLLGFPIVEAEDMPDLSDNSLSIAFGDFGRGYLIVDRAGVRVLRDPYSSKPYVLFYITKRVGGGVQDFDAIKLIKFGTA